MEVGRTMRITVFVLVVLATLAVVAFLLRRTRASEPPASSEFLVDTKRVVLAPGPVRGLATIRSVTADGVVFALAGGNWALTLPRVTLKETTRELMDSGAAQAGLAELETPGVPDPRHSKLRFIASIKTLSRGTGPEMVERLRQLYASPWQPTFGDRKLIAQYEDALLPELALVLNTETAKLTERIHQHHPVFTATAIAPPELPWEEVGSSEKVPLVPGLDPLGSVEFSGAILVGERIDRFQETNNGLARLEIKPGTWHAYLATEKDTEDESAHWLVILHASALKDWPIAVQEAATATPGGGRRWLQVVDAEALSRAEVMDAARYLGGTNVYYRKAVCAASEELPAAVPISSAGPAGAATVLVIPLDQAATGHSPGPRAATP